MAIETVKPQIREGAKIICDNCAWVRAREKEAASPGVPTQKENG